MSESAVKLGWGHININVSDLERSIGFYELLGFRRWIPGVPYLGLADGASAPMQPASAEALGLPEGIAGRACILTLGDAFPKLDLTEFADTDQRPAVSSADLGLVRICLVSEDLHADHERLSAAGVHFLSPPQFADGGLADIATCVDPDGTLIELLQVYPDKWAALADGSGGASGPAS